MSFVDASNYQLLGLTAELKADIAQVILTVTADNQKRYYRQANPVFTETITGFVAGENLLNAGVRGEAYGSTDATILSRPGSYLIRANAGTLNADNYLFSALIDGTLEIVDIPLISVNETQLYGILLSKNCLMHRTEKVCNSSNMPGYE